MDPAVPTPDWVSGHWYSVTRTPEELSVVCDAKFVPDDVVSQKPWRALVVEGPLAFSEIGILAEIASVLRDSGVSLFAISTFDTDTILVASADLSRALRALAEANHEVPAVT